MAIKMKIRDEEDYTNGEDEVIEMQGDTIRILADDGWALFSITLTDEGEIIVSASSSCKHKGVLLDSGITITPKAGNSIVVSRPKF